MELTINGINPADVNITINGVDYVPVYIPDYFTVADVFYHYAGVKEYDGIVAVIQKWYYGSLVKDSWCATAMSWALAQLGLRDYTLKGKFENVYLMNQALMKACSDGRCEQIPTGCYHYGDIIVLSFDDGFSITSNKHITSFVDWDGGLKIKCIGGNQNDGIFEKSYFVKDIVQAYRPNYYKGTLKKLANLPEG